MSLFISASRGFRGPSKCNVSPRRHCHVFIPSQDGTRPLRQTFSGMPRKGSCAEWRPRFMRSQTVRSLASLSGLGECSPRTAFDDRSTSRSKTGNFRTARSSATYAVCMKEMIIFRRKHRHETRNARHTGGRTLNGEKERDWNAEVKRGTTKSFVCTPKMPAICGCSSGCKSV